MKELKGLDFLDALRLVMGTERKICFEGKWYTVFRFSGVRSVGLVTDGDKTTDTWWPTDEQAKEKAWEVEPKIKRCPFCGASAKPWVKGSIECSECGTLGPEPIKNAEAAAVKAWNQRAAEI